MSGLEKAILIFGTQLKLAEAIGTSQQNISNWLKAGKVSPEFVIPIESATSGRVTRHELRPDIYPYELAS
ncbi:Putative antitoxin of toxin-antitoxin system, YdaS/YdaT [Nitrosomonas aestuarii]|uniref:Putative antitoxin of toxin-antitoxin system, YdaS/YdaT n=1 Tax=Nitrosomonas aestuarii TaxID=52441 RepID=A0A1I4B8M6_9PROT|nr:helix-turn-helix domain-containing protein [Nitrosomonas aestuarii]SFK64266.1 Putative antitoxin of toxin-antitoxin system, YdaS/YdaT [Nitrosomonas aestuarii]